MKNIKIRLVAEDLQKVNAFCEAAKNAKDAKRMIARLSL